MITLTNVTDGRITVKRSPSVSSAGSPAKRSEPPRRVRAVLFADVVGYTAMAAEDEARAYSTWTTFLREAVEPIFQAHRVEILRVLGDGVLAAFVSATDAIASATALQEALFADRRTPEPAWPRLSLRIAVNLCEVFVDKDDLHGDGVNVAHRLQARAAADAVILSQTARDAAGSELDGRVRDLGYISLKGVASPVRVYECVLKTEPPAGLVAPDSELPSIAVMPFENLGGRPEDTYFADGLVEDVIVSLAGLHELVVVARSSTLAFRDRQIDPREAHRVFGVRYVLQGSVRRSRGSLRLSATLTDCVDGAALFATRRDMPEDRLFEEQDLLIEEIVANIAPHVRQAELARALRKPPQVFSAYDLLLRALHEMQSLDRAAYGRAGALLDAAMVADPAFAAPCAWKTSWYCVMLAQDWIDDRDAAIEAADAMGRRAISLDENNALALAAYGHVRAFLKGDFEGALHFHDRARKAGPSHALAWLLSAGGMAYVGRGDEAVAFAEYAIRLAPFDQIRFTQYDWMAMCNYVAGRFESAANWANRALADQPAHLPSLRLRAASCAAMRDESGALRARDAIMALAPNFRLAEYAARRRTFAPDSLQCQWLEHLRAAGLPD